ncbi:MAG TPA: glycosyltransferase, partial [Candidatus Hydrogenedentes bacterium]|nr:glycosyltransferase [Candidatus Hydrogenedentota bacterium]
MNVLCMGQPFGADDSNVRLFRSTRGHEIRTLAAETGADYTFDPRDTAAEVVRRVAQAWPPDVLFCWVPEMYPPPRAVEDCPIKTVAATSDWNIYFPQIEYNLSRYDVVLTDKLGAESLRLWRTEPRYFFPLYSQRTPVHRKLDVEKDIDILYAGNLNYSIHVERGRLLEQVASLSDRRRVVIGGGFPDDEYTRLMNRARIAFNYGVRHEMNLRAFEALACNALLFLEEDNREVRDCLRDREHVVLYRQDNLVELLEFYLDHDDQAERIRAQGAAKAPELAGENRWGDLLDWIALQPARERPFGALPEPVRAFAELMQYASSQAPGQRVLVGEQIGDALDRYPDRPEFAAAAGSFALFNLRALSGAARKRSVRRIVQWFEQASALAPSEVVFRLNLAFVCRHGGATAGEIDCLERALDADGCGYGGLLLSPLEGYYANAWR